jgi:RNA polymerase sigma-70 factor (ECF subfamily)
MNTIKNLTDQDLVTRFAAGNSDGIEELVNRYKDRIYTSVYYLVKDKYLAEDIFQDVFIKIIDTIRLGKYTDEGKFLPWALRIAHNMCVDHFRKVKRTPTIKTADGSNIFDVLNFKEDSQEEVVMQRQTHDKVRKMIDMLPEEQKEVIILRHYADLSFKEIADITKCSINTALGRMRYGLINLRRIMEEKQIAL